MQATQISPETIFQHHLQAFIDNDIEELLKDYDEESVLLTPEGMLKGLDAISKFYSEIFGLFPKGTTQLELVQKIILEDKVYVVWKGESPLINTPLGTDTFQMKSDKILWQSLAAHIVPK